MFADRNFSLSPRLTKLWSIAGLLAFGGLLCLFSGNTIAATYYVSPTGSASWSECTNIDTPCAAETSMQNAVAGDIVYFRGGKYELYYDETKSPNEYWYSGVLNPSNSGTANNPITFAGYPDETPVLNCHTSDALNFVDNCRAFSNGNQNYITFDGFKIIANDGVKMGGIIISGKDIGTRVVGNIVRNIEINGGTTVVTTTDNREGIRAEETDGTLIQNVKVYNFRQVNNWHNTSGYKGYHNSNLIIEKSEFFNCSEGIYWKSDHDNSIARYNYIHDNYNGMSVYAFLAISNTTGKIEHNVFANNDYLTLAIIGEDGATSDNFEINNNIFYGSNTAYGLNYSEGSNYKVWNNIIQGFANKQYTNGKSNIHVTESDHNQFGSAALTILTNQYQTNQARYTTLSDWRSSSELTNGGNPGAGSMASDPRFVNASGSFTELSDFELAPDSPCIGAGRNGNDMGPNINLVGYKPNSKVPKAPILH